MSFKSFSTAQAVPTKEQSDKQIKVVSATDQPAPKADKALTDSEPATKS